MSRFRSGVRVTKKYYVGHSFVGWTITEEMGEQRVKASCRQCGKIVEHTRASSLLASRGCSDCGHRARVKKVIGQTHSGMTIVGTKDVLEPNSINLKYKRRHYQVQCESCQKIKWVLASNFKKMKSCGCGRYLHLFGEHGESGLNTLWHSYESSAKGRKLEFSLNKEEFSKLTSSLCFYCGQDPSKKKARANRSKSDWGDYFYNGIDRIDSSKGYTLDNCATCCSNCNYAKMQMTSDEFRLHIIRIYAHWASKAEVLP
jgi:hypothetical protein